MVEGPAPGRESVIAIDEQDRENVVADGLKTSHADKGNRRGNKSVFLGAFPNEINSLGRRFGSHQPPHQSRPFAPHGPGSQQHPHPAASRNATTRLFFVCNGSPATPA